jgi:hypothetical protein
MTDISPTSVGGGHKHRSIRFSPARGKGAERSQDTMTIRPTLAALAAAAAALACAAPASADGTTYWGTGPVQGVTTDYGNGAGAGTATASGQSVASDSTTTVVAFECAVAQAAVAASSSCYLSGADGSIWRMPSSGAAPGPADARASVGLKVPFQTYRVCQDVRATLVDASMASFSHCTRTIVPAGVS